MTPDEQRAARKHLLRLAQRHGIQINWRPQRRWDQFEAHVGERIIWVRKTWTLMDYVTTLHEIGHVVLGADPTNGHRAELEAACWEWAVKKMRPAARRSLTAEDWDLIAGAWVSNLRW